jgi:2-oxoglutarate dehydrogenase E2 component (dihydrolipoamide succinyltransferase)
VPAPSAGVLGESSPRKARPWPSARCSARSPMAAAAPSRKPAAAPGKGRHTAAPATAPAGCFPGAQKSAPSMPPGTGGPQDARPRAASADQVPGSGKRGRVTKGDVLAAIAKGISAPADQSAAAAVQARAVARDDAAREERVKMTRLRQTIARRLKDAQNTAAMLTTFNEVDMTNVMALRAKYKDVFEKKHGVKLGFMGFFTKAVRAGAEGTPGRQRRDRRHRPDLQELLPRRRCRRHRQGPRRSGRARCRPMSIADIEKDHRPISASAPATASSRSTTCRAAPSPSPMAASTVR